MASASLICSSGTLPCITVSMRGDHCSIDAVPSRQATLCRRACSTKSSRLLRGAEAWASSLSTKVQAVEESTSAEASAVAEEINGGGGGCPGCGKAEIIGGCNGEGRIQGGIGAVPGFRWWPIKAFRPCPAFIETGGRYRRIGQSLEEVAFGRKGGADDLDISDRLKG